MGRGKIATIVVVLALGAWGARMWKHPSGPKRREDQGEPQKTADQILQERANQASSHLLTPLGKAFVAKNWNEVHQLFRTEENYVDLAEIIRAFYIQNQFSSFSSEDMDQVLKLTYDTIERLDSKNRPKAGLLITQFMRLPLPQKRSSTYQQLESWLAGGPKNDDFLRRISILKLVTQDMNPPEKAVKAFISGYLSPLAGATQTEWIRSTNDIRSVKVREKCASELFALYSKLPPSERPQALIVLSREAKSNRQHVAKLTVESLESNEPTLFEAGLRAAPNLTDPQAFDSKQIETIVKRLTQLPDKLKTPFVTAKIDDLLPKLSTKH